MVKHDVRVEYDMNMRLGNKKNHSRCELIMARVVHMKTNGRNRHEL
jgi:hypothetical protein